ncbi:luc7-like protein 1 [Leptotrombidium deliense]|uniref:Luc7-like protein 1 n=1 Tax=Leptotrombidium deliense TaxID=299467 RepID=A0A443S836_9ACAR|nr:luc7-like protein 1 [Leptotrombidium deliense]
MALQNARALLDELMGRERDLRPSEKTADESEWSDSRICKFFLVNFCPNQLFTNTKADMGPCHKVHDDFIKKLYEQKASRREKMMYEDEFIRFCQQTLNDVERRIKRARQRLAASQTDKANASGGATSGTPYLSEELQEKMQVLSDRIEQLLQQIEELGCEGKVEEAQGIMKLVEKLKEEKMALKRDNLPMHWIQQRAEIGAAQEKQMEVCDVCGAFLIVNDVQQRVDDHLMGKQHVGYGKLKTALDEILQRRKSQRNADEKQETTKIKTDNVDTERKREERSRSTSFDRERNNGRYERYDKSEQKRESSEYDRDSKRNDDSPSNRHRHKRGDSDRNKYRWRSRSKERRHKHDKDYERRRRKSGSLSPRK